jgi:TonB family protein
MKKLQLTIFLFIALSVSIFAQAKFGYVNVSNANVRTMPNTDAEVLTLLPFGTKVKILSKKHLNGWYQIQIGKKIGWLNGNTFSIGKLVPKTRDEPIEDNSSDEPENLEAEGWFYVTANKSKNTAASISLYFQKDKIKRDSLGNTSVWFKIIPNNPVLFSRQAGSKRIMRYALQFITAYCGDERLTREKLTFYDRNGDVIEIPPSFDYREPIIPGSVGEGVYDAICKNYTAKAEAASSPKVTENGNPRPMIIIQPYNPNPQTPAPKVPSGPISGGVVNGKATYLPKPPYPAAAKAVRAAGTVSVQVLIDEDGNVVSATSSSGHPLLRAAAEQAARDAKFSPTLLNGEKVKVSGILTFNFIAQ